MTTFGFNLAEDALLIKVSICGFTGRKKDKALAAEVATAKNADSEAISTNLSSLDKEDRMPIQSIGTAARNFLNDCSAMWDKDGWRLIGNASYEEIRQKLEGFKAEYMIEVDKLVARRDELAAKAQRKLGKLWDRVPFPTAEALREQYEFEISTQAIANPDDIRLRHVSPAQAAKIAEGARKEHAAKTRDALCQLVERLRESVGHAAEKLADDEAIFRDTLISNIQSVCALVPTLNLTGDPYITNLAKEIAETIGTAKPEVLRTDKNARETVAAKAREAVKKSGSLLDKLRAGAVSNKVN